MNGTATDVVAPNDTPLECMPVITRPSLWVRDCVYNELYKPVKVGHESPAFRPSSLVKDCVYDELYRPVKVEHESPAIRPSSWVKDCFYSTFV